MDDLSRMLIKDIVKEVVEDKHKLCKVECEIIGIGYASVNSGYDKIITYCLVDSPFNIKRLYLNLDEFESKFDNYVVGDKFFKYINVEM